MTRLQVPPAFANQDVFPVGSVVHCPAVPRAHRELVAVAGLMTCD